LSHSPALALSIWVHTGYLFVAYEPVYSVVYQLASLLVLEVYDIAKTIIVGGLGLLLYHKHLKEPESDSE
jgi:hypothetical protein